MRRRSSHQTPPPQPPKHQRPSVNGGSSGIKDGAPLTRCSVNSCRDVAPDCFAQLSKKCANSGVTTRWFHISLGEHYCSACYEELSKGNGLTQNYRTWVNAWTGNSKNQPSYRLFIAEEILPYWVQCIGCQKWRFLPKEVELDSNLIAEYTCSSPLTSDYVKNCSTPEDPRVKQIKDIKWMETLAVPPLLKHSPAAKFLNDEYFMDGVGMSPSTKKLDNDLIKFDPVISEIMQPFYQPHENGKALCIRPDVMEYDEVLEFPEYSREHVLYLGLRNLIIALWNVNPKQWLTPAFCLEHLICRGMVRILCAKELLRILRFLNRKGVVNCGVLRNPPYPLLGSDGQVKKLKVIVVGAGMAGLAAARQMQNFGAQVTVLEARARLGGRIWDDFSLGVVVGRGAQLVTGIINNPITLMCLQGGIKFKKLGEECPLIMAKNGSLVPMKTDKRVDFHFNAMLDAVEDWRRQAKRDETLQSTLDIMHRLFLDQSKITLTPAEDQLLNFHLSNLEYSCGAPLSEVSSMHWDQNERFAQFAGEHASMTDGYSSIIDRLADGVDIRTEFEVTKIDYSGQMLKVYGKQSKPLLCHKVLITLPLSVLQWETVEFKPPLPNVKKRAISSLGAGIIEKVALKFPTKFWHGLVNGADYFGNVPDSEEVKNQFSIFYDFSAKNPVANEHNFVLMSYLSGNAAKLVRIKTDEEIVEMAMNSLRKLFSNKEIPEPDNYLVTHWWEDPCSGMSYSYVKVGSSGPDYDALADEIDEKLYFAGEATNRHFPQTVAGAYLSGLREAAKIVADSS